MNQIKLDIAYQTQPFQEILIPNKWNK